MGTLFSYFHVPDSNGVAGRTPFGGPWFERPLQTLGEYANLTPGAWWNGNIATLDSAEYPCAGECVLTCGLFSGWPTFVRVHLTIDGVSSPGHWEADLVPYLQTTTEVRCSHVFFPGPGSAALYSRSSCESRMYDASYPYFYPQTTLVDPTIVDPLYVFTQRSTVPLTLFDSGGVGYFTANVRFDMYR